MKLSEAILLGSSLCKAKCDGSDYEKPSKVGGCALEMALLANGIDENWVKAERTWSWLNDISTLKVNNVFESWAIAIGCTFDTQVMIFKNWTFEQFVDWVRSIEPAEDEQADVTTPETVSVQVRQ